MKFLFYPLVWILVACGSGERGVTCELSPTKVICNRYSFIAGANFDIGYLVKHTKKQNHYTLSFMILVFVFVLF
jgi:hypothetical protein